MSIIVQNNGGGGKILVKTSGSSGAAFPGGDLTSGTGTTVTVGSGLNLAGGTLSATGGGITQLTGDVQAGPGNGSVSSNVTFARGVFNGNNYVFTFRDSRGSLQAHDAYPGAHALGWSIPDPFTSDLWLGSGCDGGSPFNQIIVQGNLLKIGPTFSGGPPNAIQIARTGNYYNTINSFAQGQIWSQHRRLTNSGPGPAAYVLDAGPAGCDYFLECAYSAGSGGVVITTPATPWSTLGPSAGRTFMITDVLGTCSAIDPIVLNDPSGRTFNGTATLTIDKPSNVATVVLDSTLNNWIVSFQSGSPI